ncbi:hypothetical protein [Variovorax sp. 770b2]|uniref:hypothetical protein n=1 Tax=Variovorax sp. 770b2 TaxID=1566271 RepID=UPI0008EE1B88|nr:hypothetical protein [Variovorax sp. 770b2]SFP48178.1 hypothetical protein SAMN03159339_2639 [Variovorax sp. 770b2]
MLSLARALVALLLPLVCGESFAARIWAETKLASATQSIDIKRQRTLIGTYYLAVTGPDNVKKELERYAKTCVTTSLGSGTLAYHANPSPEPATKLASAVAAFKVALKACAAAKPAFEALAGKFELGLKHRSKWKKGIQIKGNIENPMAPKYRELSKYLKDRAGIGGDGGKLLDKTIGMFIDGPKVNLRLPPVKVPSPKKAGKYVRDRLGL